MKICIDAERKCHASGDGSGVEVAFFDGKCEAFLEGYRYIPQGETWTREDGKVFRGEMVAPWKPYAQLDRLQREHERRLLAEYAQALETVGVTL